MKRIISFFIKGFGQKPNKDTTPQAKTFLEVLNEAIEHHVTQRQLSVSTRSKYRNFYDNIEKFFISKGMKEVKVDQVRLALFEELRRYLHSELKSCGITHSSRHLETCVAAMDFAVRNEYIKYNPISMLETGRDRVKGVINPDGDELRRLLSYKFTNKGFQTAQILYAFQSATGLSYGNLFDYRTTIDAETGGLWIEDNRKKIGQKPFYVPLDAPGFELAKAIHDTFQGVLPRLSNGTYNRYLKEMADIVGVKKRLTTHTARKAFATMMDQEDFSLGVISSILGNSEQICRVHYINPSKKKIEHALAQKGGATIIKNAMGK